MPGTQPSSAKGLCFFCFLITISRVRENHSIILGLPVLIPLIGDMNLHHNTFDYLKINGLWELKEPFCLVLEAELLDDGYADECLFG